MGCQSIPMDKGMSAELGNSASVVLCGLGEECRIGMLFAQLPEGTPTNDEITLKIPKLDCGEKYCARYQVFNPNGMQGKSGGIPDKTQKVTLSLADLVEADEISKSTEGEWLITVRMWFADNDGNEMSALGWSFVRINVLDKNYINIGCDDPVVAWRVGLPGGHEAQYTSKLRSALCGSH